MTDTYEGQTGKKYDLSFIFDMTNDALQCGDKELALQFTERALKQAQAEGNHRWIKTFEQVRSNLNLSQQKIRVAKGHDLTKMKGIGPSTAEKLQQAGIRTINELLEKTESQLSQIQGIGMKAAQKMLTNAYEYGKFHKIISTSEEMPIDQANNQNDLIVEGDDLEDIDENEIQSEKELTPYQQVKAHHQEQQLNIKEVEQEPIDMFFVQESPNSNRRFEEKLTFPGKTATYFKDTELSTTPQLITHQSISNEVDRSISELREEVPISSNVMDSISDIMQERGYYFIPSQLHKQYPLNLLAVQVLEIDENRNLILIVPLIIDSNQHSILVSEQTIRYDIKNRSEIAEVNIYSQQLIQVAETLFTGLINGHHFFNIIKNTLKMDLSIEKSIEHKNLYFYVGNIEYKMRVDPVLVTEHSPLFSEKTIAFAYQRHSNLHVINLDQVSHLLEFLEQKYITLEIHSKKSNSMKSYKELKEKFSRYFQMMQIPFMGYLMLFGITFFSNLPLLVNIMISLGYAAMGIYLFSSGFLYYLVFREKCKMDKDFMSPFHKKIYQISDDELFLINVDLKPDYMEQLGYECFGKNHSYKTLHEIEHRKIEQEIIEKPITIQAKMDELYEAQEPKPTIDKSIIEKYSSFLED
ncbi:MAG: helix-hairpin-helix domain-containing protein [Candidatus Heimdallarchaeota archaeon]